MKKRFYRLGSPSPGKPHQIYGRSAWYYRTYSLAAWSEFAAGFGTGRFYPPYGEPKKDLAIVLPTPKVGDFVWTWYSDCIVPDRTLALFKEAGFTGFGTRPVIIEKIERRGAKRRKETPIPPLWELLIRGKGGDAAPESGIVPFQYEDCSGVVRNAYTSFRNGIIVDEANWDGSDFFTVNGYPKYLLVTERVKELIMDRQLTNCALIPSHKLEWGSGVTPEGSHARTLELAARPLESLLADLEDPELINDAIYGLGCKGDARAVEPLIRKFDDPDSSIPGSAADAIASIVKHKETPEHTREEIFSKLCVLLGHNDPVVRKSAARALSSTRSERAAREIMRLFDDPDEWVRATVVWELGCHRYKPALDSVRRLTRDRSELVREIARMMVYRIEFDSP
jgi:hypothetical protein